MKEEKLSITPLTNVSEHNKLHCSQIFDFFNFKYYCYVYMYMHVYVNATWGICLVWLQ